MTEKTKDLLSWIEKNSGYWGEIEDEDLQNTDFLNEWVHAINKYDSNNTKRFVDSLHVYIVEYDMDIGSDYLDFEQHFQKNRGLQLVIEHLPQTFFNKMIDEMEVFRKKFEQEALEEERRTDPDYYDDGYEQFAMAFANYQNIFKKHKDGNKL